jgi:DHA2 family multidrug resistance protein
MDYPVVTAGLVMGPRGVGTMASMLIVGRLVGRSIRASCWHRPRPHGVVVQSDDRLDAGRFAGDDHRRRHGAGRGLGFLFVPLSAATLSTLPLAERTEGAGLLQPVAQYRLQRRHFGGEQPADAEHPGQPRRHCAARHAVNRGFENPAIAHFWNPLTAAGRAALDAVITQQAQIIAYIDDYKLRSSPVS